MLEEAALTLAACASRSRSSRSDRAHEAPRPDRGGARQLEELVAEQTAASAEELKTRLARMRADSLSILAEDERRIADERRRELAERERAAGVELADALAATAGRVEERLRGWSDDLEHRDCAGSSSGRSS